MKFERSPQLRWSDMDPNMHIRSSVYYDLGAQLRTEYFFSKGLSLKLMAKYGVGLVLLREEAVFKKELMFGDELLMNVLLVKCKKDASRFSIRHEITKRDELCTILNIDAAWIDLAQRKLSPAPEPIRSVMDEIPRALDFEWFD